MLKYFSKKSLDFQGLIEGPFVSRLVFLDCAEDVPKQLFPVRTSSLELASKSDKRLVKPLLLLKQTS
jgi:hypothetical protein